MRIFSQSDILTVPKKGEMLWSIQNIFVGFFYSRQYHAQSRQIMSQKGQSIWVTAQAARWAQLTNLWWMSNLVSESIGPAHKHIKGRPLTQCKVSWTWNSTFSWPNKYASNLQGVLAVGHFGRKKTSSWACYSFQNRLNSYANQVHMPNCRRSFLKSDQLLDILPICKGRFWEMQ